MSLPADRCRSLTWGVGLLLAVSVVVWLTRFVDLATLFRRMHSV